MSKKFTAILKNKVYSLSFLVLLFLSFSIVPAFAADFTVTNMVYNPSTSTYHVSTPYNTMYAPNWASFIVNADTNQNVEEIDSNWSGASNYVDLIGVSQITQAGFYYLKFSQPSATSNIFYLNSSGNFDTPPTPTPTNTPTPTPTPAPVVQVITSPSNASVNVGVPFNVDVKVTDSGQAFNAAQATVVISSSLSIVSVNNPRTNACNFNYTKSPTTSDPSFAGAIFNGSSTGCTVYTMTLLPTTVGTGTVTFNNSSVKSYSNGSEMLTGIQNGSYSISAAAPSPTPPGTTLVTVDDSVQGSNQNEWNFVGGWSHCTDTSNPGCNPNLYNNSVSWDNTTNDYVTLSFTGIRVALSGLVDPNHGIAAVSIDGGSETNVDFYSATRTGNVLLWTSPLLTAGQHTLKVRVTGNKNSNSGGTWLAIDRGDIFQTDPEGLTITNTVLDTYDSSFTLTGTKGSSLTSIFVNGSSSNSTYPTSIIWQAVESVSFGDNSFQVYGKDDSNNQTASINVTVKRHILGDINGDGVIDLVDASLFAVDWGKTGNLTYPLSDMNNDGVVNLTDFSVLAKLEQ